MENKTKHITRTGILLAVTLVIQMMGMPQLVTGSAVNAMLLIALLTVGVLEASIIGCITPIIALMVGIIKPPLAPVIPFIIGGNVILVVGFYHLKKINNYMALIVAALAKFILLFGATKLVLATMLPEPIFKKVAVTFGVTQFFTAMAGGVIALIIVPLLKNYLDKENNANA